MAKKDDFDFETEGKGKFSLDLSFFTNLTKQQKGVILAAIAAIVVIAIVVVCVLIGANSNSNNGGNSNGNNDFNGESNSDNNTQDGIESDDIENMYVSTQPNKLVYYVGDLPDYSGLVVCINTISAGTCFESYDANPDAFTFTGFDSSAPVEEQQIIFEYKGKILSFNIKIIEVPSVSSVLQSIYIDPMPKTEYKVDEALDLSGAKIVAVYSDGTTVVSDLTMRRISGYSAAKGVVGEHILTVKYFDDNGGYAETTFTITITE